LDNNVKTREDKGILMVTLIGEKITTFYPKGVRHVMKKWSSII